jgi:Multisubunit Na+/H+ antiporter, MnhF subunit
MNGITTETIAFLMITIAMVLAFSRLVRGPTLPDRVIALDLSAILSTSFLSIYAIDSGQRVYLDVAIVLALIAFLGTVAFALYMERRARDE